MWFFTYSTITVGVCPTVILLTHSHFPMFLHTVEASYMLRKNGIMGHFHSDNIRCKIGSVRITVGFLICVCFEITSVKDLWWSLHVVHSQSRQTRLKCNDLYIHLESWTACGSNLIWFASSDTRWTGFLSSWDLTQSETRTSQWPPALKLKKT